jgi:hypothetical protein
VTEILTVAGPGAEQLDWVARLYGQADPKYRDPAFLEHLFLRNPIGPSLHAFAVEGETPIGHICIVRTRARYGPEDLPAGKLEGLWIEASHRGRRADGHPLVRTLLSKLYAFSDDQGVELVHALATPRIGQIIGFTPLSPAGARSLVSVVSPNGAGVAGRALALAQRVAREAAAAPVRTAGLRPAGVGDADLAEVPPAPTGRWAVVADDAWGWYCSSPLVRVLELEGCRALVQLPAAPHEPLRLVGWRAERPRLRTALGLIAAAGRLAREQRAASLRFQPWPSAAVDGSLARACALTGFLSRSDLTTVWVRATREELVRAKAVVSTPFLYLGF